jgi:hypothetical protein
MQTRINFQKKNLLDLTNVESTTNWLVQSHLITIDPNWNQFK